jgi:cysteine synthase
MEIYENLLETLGNTPLVKLDRYAPEGATVVVKL